MKSTNMDNSRFIPNCRAVLIGSLPVSDHLSAVRMILDHTPDFPLWPQLPKNPKEGMIRQFLDGFPGLTEQDSKFWINTDANDFELQLASFYEDYFSASEDPAILKDSRFSLSTNTATGFFSLLESVGRLSAKPLGLKGQITGPITTGIGVKNGQGRSIFFNDDLCDVLVKLMALKSRWQVDRLAEMGCAHAPILFIDEPGMVSFGASAFTGVTRERAGFTLSEIITAIQTSGGLAGIHICANGDWSLALESNADIISFDAYSYFEHLMLYKPELVRFLQRGGALAWGIVPTLDPSSLEKETFESLSRKIERQFHQLSEYGFSIPSLLRQSLIAPACGTGSLTVEQAGKVLRLTKELSQSLRKKAP